jgi:hypothetical protein
MIGLFIFDLFTLDGLSYQNQEQSALRGTNLSARASGTNSELLLSSGI